MDKIKGFTKDYHFLSNYYNHTIKFDGLFYRNNIACFIAQMFESDDTKKLFSKMLPGQAIRMAEMMRNPREKEWDDIKEDLMYKICYAKFSYATKLRDQLIDTGDAELINETKWDNKFWGTTDGIGENRLGKILMRIREELKEKYPRVENMHFTDGVTDSDSDSSNDEDSQNNESPENTNELHENTEEKHNGKRKKKSNKSDKSTKELESNATESTNDK